MMKILLRTFFTFLIIVSLLGCASSYIIEMSDSEFSEELGAGTLRLTCGVSCSGSWGIYRQRMKSSHDQELWLDLGKQAYSIGHESDLGYYYLGRASEGVGHYKAALTYYTLAKSAFKCGGIINVCDGLVFPTDIDRRIQNLPSSIINTTESSEPASANPFVANTRSAEVDEIQVAGAEIPDSQFPRLLTLNGSGWNLSTEAIRYDLPRCSIVPEILSLAATMCLLISREG